MKRPKRVEIAVKWLLKAAEAGRFYFLCTGDANRWAKAMFREIDSVKVSRGGTK